MFIFYAPCRLWQTFVEYQMPSVSVMETAVEEWRDRWPSTFQGGEDVPEGGGEQMWHLAKGFDAIAEWMGGKNTNTLLLYCTAFLTFK